MGLPALLSFGMVVILATLVGIGFRAVKLPLILAYLTTGVLIFGSHKIIPGFQAELSYLPQFGVAFLLFLVGMELDIKRLGGVGKAVIISSVGQMVCTTGLVAMFGRWAGLTIAESFYLGLGVSFSSTIIIVKLFLDKHELDSLHGRIALGITLVEDLVAVMVLMFLSLSGSYLELGLTASIPLVSLLVKALGLGLFAWGFSRYVVVRILEYVAVNMELLFLSAVAICFLFIELFVWSGFSLEIGAFVAGVVLGNSDFRLQIASRVKPLRDLFVAIFFIELGLMLGRGLGETNFWMVFVLVIFSLAGKPLFFMFALTWFGYKRHSLFQAAVGLSQVSEFSLIMLSLALSKGQVGQPVLSTIALTVVVTMSVSTFTITNSERIYALLKPIIDLFPFGKRHEETGEVVEISQHTVLVGCDRSGTRIVAYFKQLHGKLVVVDFNPDVFERLKSEKVDVIFGDMADSDVVEKAGIGKAKLIITTVRNINDNLALLEYLKKFKSSAKVIMSANTTVEASVLKKEGANRVVVPMALEGEYVVSLLKRGLAKI